MPSLSLDGKLIWFAHCPKSGGTSVERFMVDHWGPAVGHLHWGWDLWWKAGGWRLADPPNSPQHLIWADAIQHLPRPPDAVFAIVRDPLARMLSEYRFQRTTRRGTTAGRMLARLSFSSWIRIMLRLAAQNPYAFDNHFRAQGDFTPGHSRIFHLENGLGDVAHWLAKETGLEETSAAFPRELVSGRRAKIKVHAEDVALISKVFASDYVKYGYRIPDPGTYPCDPISGFRDAMVRRVLPALHRLECCGKL